MKAKDLIKELEKHPDWEVTVSVDISTNEDEMIDEPLVSK